MTEQRKGLYKGIAVATIFFVIILAAAYFYVDKTYIQPLEKAGIL